MRKGLTQPPINAPVLPAGMYYHIAAQKEPYGSDVCWYVTIESPRSFWFSKRVAWAHSHYDRKLIETALRQACEKAYDNMVRNMSNADLCETYSGDWAGQ